MREASVANDYTAKAGLTVRLFATVLFLLPGLTRAETRTLFTFREPHMGTLFTIRIYGEKEEAESIKAAAGKAFDRVAGLNSICSDYLPESELNNFARGPSGLPIVVSRDLFDVFQKAIHLSKATRGAFDPTAGPLIRLWRTTKKNGRLPPPGNIDSALRRTGYRHLELDPAASTITKKIDGMLFDLGGIAKGYAADAALQVLREAGHTCVLVAASGDIVVGDPPPGKDGWTIGIEALDLRVAPKDMPTVILKNQAISTSGDARQFIELDGIRYSHIVSTETGLGLTERIAATVIAPDATTSDSYATAAVLLGKTRGLKFIEDRERIECRIVSLQDQTEIVTKSPGFPQP